MTKDEDERQCIFKPYYIYNIYIETHEANWFVTAFLSDTKYILISLLH